MKMAASGTYCETHSPNAWRKMHHRSNSDDIIYKLRGSGINANALVEDMNEYIEKMGKLNARDIKHICKIVMESNT